MLFFKEKSPKPVERTSYVLGTIVHFKVYGNKAENAISEAIDKLNEIDDKMSAFKENSEVCMINEEAGVAPVAVSQETYKLIKKALTYSEILHGSFDITVRPLVNLWGIGTENANVPDKEDIQKTLKLVNYKDIMFDDEFSSIMLRREKQAVDLGGIAKGYAADCVRDIFKKNKIKNAVIDLGGNILVLGKKENKDLWKVGIQDPEKGRGKYVGTLSIRDKSVVTSGNYEKYFEKDGVKYHHIIDTKTGYPSQSKIISATIISDNSIDGDGLSTGVYILGVDKAIKIIEHMKGVDTILITQDRKVYTTSGVRKSFILSDKEYTCENN